VDSAGKPGDTHLQGRPSLAGLFRVGGFMPEQRDPSSPEPVSLPQAQVTRESGQLSPFAFFSLCALAFLTTGLFLSGVHPEQMAFWASGKLRFSHMLLTVTPSLWVAAALVMFHEWRSGRTPGSAMPRPHFGVAVSLVLSAIMILGPVLTPFFSSQSLMLRFLERADELMSLPGFRTKFIVLNILGFVSVWLLASGIFVIHLRLRDRFQQRLPLLEQAGAEHLAEDVRWYQQHRARLERLLGFLAAAIGAVILNTGALRMLLKEAAPGQPELLPASAVMALGAYYTWLLAIIYLPIRKSLNDVGQALAESLVRQSLGGHVTWKQWFEERQAVRTYLGLQGSALQDLQQGLSLLAPLLASISSLAFGSQA
jgi:hypothetical protein